MGLATKPALAQERAKGKGPNDVRPAAARSRFC